MVGGINRFVSYCQARTFEKEGQGTSRAELSFFSHELPDVDEVHREFKRFNKALQQCFAHCYDVPLETFWDFFWSSVRDVVFVQQPDKLLVVYG